VETLALTRAVHVVGVVLWIGGVALVTTVLLPALRALPNHDDPIGLFERIERRFACQARVITVLTGLSGFYLLHRLDGWQRYLSFESWWLHAMTLVWLIFTLLLFVLEPLVLHRRLSARAARDPRGTLALLERAHRVLLAISLLTVAGAVAGSHGWTPR
jgi:uncharacterized membrane protein